MAFKQMELFVTFIGGCPDGVYDRIDRARDRAKFILNEFDCQFKPGQTFPTVYIKTCLANDLSSVEYVNEC